MKKRILAAFIALLLVFTTVPHISAETASDWTVPEGYNEHDYNKCATFLEQADENGVKNGEKLFDIYDPSDPSTWGDFEEWDDDAGEVIKKPRFEWIEADNELHLRRIVVQYLESPLAGEADFSDCSYLWVAHFSNNQVSYADFSNCITLDTLELSGNEPLTEINAVGCVSLNYIGFDNCPGVTSIENIPNNVGFMCVSRSGVTELDLSDFSRLYGLEATQTPFLTKIDASGCSALQSLRCQACNVSELVLPDYKENLVQLFCDTNQLTELELDYPNLMFLYCGTNPDLSELDLSMLTQLQVLVCDGDSLESLDISMCPDLFQIYCPNNQLTELDMSSNPHLFLDEVHAEGDGTIGYWCENRWEWPGFPSKNVVFASANEDAEFLGWYNEAGELLSTELVFDAGDYIDIESVLIARFSGGEEPLPGDIDGDGSVSVTDAILALRGAMGIYELSPEQAAAGDMDGSGSVTVSDAVLILRTAMGIA